MVVIPMDCSAAFLLFFFSDCFTYFSFWFITLAGSRFILTYFLFLLFECVCMVSSFKLLIHLFTILPLLFVCILVASCISHCSLLLACWLL